MTFPTIPTTAGGTLLFSTAVGSGAARTFPNLSSLTKNSGDLLVAVAVAYQSSAAAGAVWSGWPSGWTEFADVGGGTSSMTIGAAWKISTGTETGTFTITQAATITGDCVMWLMAIPGAHATQAPEHTAISIGTTTVSSAGTLTPSWGSDDNLFIAIGGNGETSITGSWTGAGTTPPTNYTGLVNAAVADTSTVGQADSSVAFRQLTASTDTIGAFSGGDITNARNAAMGIVVRPAPPTPTTGPAARVSLASLSTPVTLAGYTLHFRARVQTAATATLRANLWEGATDRSGVLESTALTTSLAEYSLAVPDTNAAAIVDYTNLSVSFWGYSSTGATPVVEVADVWLQTPAASPALARTAADTNLSSDAVTLGVLLPRSSAETSVSTDSATRRVALARTGPETSLSSDAATRVALHPRVSADTSVSADAAVRRVALTRTGSETSLSSDAATATTTHAGLTRTAADTTLLSDAATRGVLLPRSNVETSVSTDSATRQVRQARTASDTSVSSDTATAVVSGGGTRTAADTSVSSDVATRVAPHLRASTDTSVSTDSAVSAVRPTRTAADTSLLSDVSTRGVRTARTSADASLSSDSASRVAPHLRVSADTSVSADSATQRVGIHRTGAEASVSVDSAAWVSTTTALSETSFSSDAAAISAVHSVTVYFSNAAATTLTTANQLVTTAPSSETSAASGQYASGVTGYSNLYSQGGNNNVLVSEPPVNVHGFLFDSTSLEGKTLQAGTWTLQWRIGAVATGFTAAPIARFWKRSSSGVYAQLTNGGVPVDFGVGAQAIPAPPSSALGITAAGPMDAVTFAAGDKLYVDMLLNITVGSTNATASNRVINLFMNGGAVESIVTPGYLLSTGSTRAVDDTSLSSDTATIGNAQYGRTASETSLSSDTAVRGPITRIAVDTSLSSDVATRIGRFARTAVDTSLSSDFAARAVPFARTTGDTSLSSDVGTVPAAISRGAADTSLSADVATVPLSLSNNFEGGAAGTTITTGNSGGASGNAFNAVVIGTGVGVTFDATNPAHGAGLDMAIVQPATAAVSYVQWAASLGTLVTNQALYGRFYFVYTGSGTRAQLLNILGGGASIAGINLSSAGKIALTKNLNVTAATSTLTLATGTLYRIEFQLTGIGGGSTSGNGQINIYAGDSVTPLDTTAAASGIDFGSVAPDTVRFGVTIGGQHNSSYYFDAINLNTTALPGPEGTHIFGRSSGDTSLSTDAAAPQILLARTGVETSLSSDAAIRAALLPARTASDTSVGSDAAIRTAQFARSVSEASLSSDAVTRVDRLARFGSDASLSSDVATGAVVAAGRNRTAADTSASSDTAFDVVGRGRTSTDTTLSSDAVVRRATLTRFVADISSSGDTAIYRASLHAISADSSTSTDAGLVALGKGRTTTNTSLSSDAATRRVVFTRAAGDTSSSGDAATQTLRSARTAGDVSVSSDVAQQLRRVVRTTSDSSLTSDATARRLVGMRLAVDSSVASDFATWGGRLGRSAIATTLSSDSATALFSQGEPPRLCFPLTASVTPYASTAAALHYGSSATPFNYTSLAAAVQYQSTAVAAPYVSTGTATHYGSNVTLTPYTSAVDVKVCI